MGFSVSGSFAIIVIGGLVALGIFASATTNGFERVTSAQQAETDAELDRQNTAIEIQNVTYDNPNETLSLRVTNNGSTALSVSATDVLVDNVYQESFAERSVEGDTVTDLWLPGETLDLEIDQSEEPDQVKIVTQTGVAATVVV